MSNEPSTPNQDGDHPPQLIMATTGGEVDPKRLWREKRRQRGLCIRCPKAAASGHTLCSKHLEAMRAAVSSLREQRRARGQCSRCDQPARPNSNMCVKHRRAATEAERRPDAEVRHCEMCSADAYGRHRYCEDCRDEGARRERDARTSAPVTPQTCRFCGTFGHHMWRCRALRACSPIASDPTFTYAASYTLDINTAQIGDVYVWLRRRESAHLPHSTVATAALTVRFGGKVRILEPGLVTPIGSHGAHGVFRYGGSPNGWRCLSRGKLPNTSEKLVDDVFAGTSVRLTNVLRRLDLTTTTELYRLGRAHVQGTWSVGRETMLELDQALAVNDLPPLLGGADGCSCLMHARGLRDAFIGNMTCAGAV